MFYTNTGLTIGSTFTPTIIGYLSPSYFQLPLTQTLYIANTSTSQIMFGNSSTPTGSLLAFGSSNNMSMAAGAHYNGAWVADATSAELVGMNGGTINFYAVNGLTVGGSIPFADVGQYSANGLGVLHFVNDTTGGTPTISGGGVLGAGSKDTFGEAQSPAGSSQLTINFSKAFPNYSYCIGNSVVNPRIWVPIARTATSLTFQCYLLTGAVCTGSDYIDYLCWGM